MTITARRPARRPQAAGAAANRLLAGFLCLFASAAFAIPAAAATGDGLSISNGWMRFIIPSRPAAGYFTLTNASDKPRILTGAASPACGMLMLHQSLRENGRDRMIMVESVQVPAHGSVSFAPGGYHLMCMSPSKDMQIGNKVRVTLRFADGSTLSDDFLVRGPMSK